MDTPKPEFNSKSLVNILTLRYDPLIKPNLPKKTWKDFTTTNRLTTEFIEKSIMNEIEQKLDSYNHKKNFYCSKWRC